MSVRVACLSRSLSGSRLRLQARTVDGVDAVVVFLSGLGRGVGILHFGERWAWRIAEAVLLKNRTTDGTGGFFRNADEFHAVSFDDETGNAALEIGFRLPRQGVVGTLHFN